MSSLMIKAIDIRDSRFLQGLPPDVFVDRLASRLIAFTATAVAGGHACDYAHYVCSSSLDVPSCSGWFDAVALCRHVRDATGVHCAYSNALQCATWGFLVRQHLTLRRHVSHIIVSIIDANPLGIRFWSDNDHWGRTGHRVTLLHLQLPSGRFDEDAAVTVARCNPRAMLYDYVHEMQVVMEKHADHTLAVPYFEEKMRKGINRNLLDYMYLPDQFEKYGHLCGADPWVSIAMDERRALASSQRYMASSIASEGYCCFLSASTDAHSCISIEG
jgi:hypothetical protein